MAVGPSDISGNDWLGPINSFFGRNLSLGPAKNDHVCPLRLAIICEEVKKE